MSPTCSSRFLVGRKTRSAADLTMSGCNSTPARRSARPNPPNVLVHWYSVLQMSDTLPQDIDFAVNRDGELPVGTQLVSETSLADRQRGPRARRQAAERAHARRGCGRQREHGARRLRQARARRSDPFRAGPRHLRHPPAADGRSGEPGELVLQIAELERQLLRRPVSAEAAPTAATGGGRLTTTEELRDIRDGLSARLRARSTPSGPRCCDSWRRSTSRRRARAAPLVREPARRQGQVGRR